MTTVKIKGAAEYLGLSEYMVRKMCRTGELPHIKAGGVYLFRLHSLDNWMDKQEAESLQQLEGVSHEGIRQIVE